jgi:acetoin utilization deacetylase AcuC-like enzyme
MAGTLTAAGVTSPGWSHDAGWVKRLRTGTLEYLELLKLELPYSRQMVEGFWLAAGGTILASQLSLCHGVGINLGGGFHHAFAAHGEGFCAIHDVAVAVRAAAGWPSAAP